MTTIVHLLAIAFATAIAAALIYRLIRKYEPRLAKGVVIIFAVFGGLLTSVASIKTNSPPRDGQHQGGNGRLCDSLSRREMVEANQSS